MLMTISYTANTQENLQWFLKAPLSDFNVVLSSVNLRPIRDIKGKHRILYRAFIPFVRMLLQICE